MAAREAPPLPEQARDAVAQLLTQAPGFRNGTIELKFQDGRLVYKFLHLGAKHPSDEITA